jgi:hypothetical protein
LAKIALDRSDRRLDIIWDNSEIGRIEIAAIQNENQRK